ncbi:hypothetical protein diail_3322 [Diaporthe ilicicola]|nr:hypothetical protein diail_3322 [Diaporthe ilicicola]
MVTIQALPQGNLENEHHISNQDLRTCKGRHFGAGGAAGILLVRRDDTKADRPATHVVLQHRSWSTAAGGTWDIPGGALHEDENPRAGAIRVASEEVGLPPDCADGADPTIIIWHEQAFFDHVTWRHTTVIADVFKPFGPSVPEGDTESLEVKWVALEDSTRRFRGCRCTLPSRRPGLRYDR